MSNIENLLHSLIGESGSTTMVPKTPLRAFAWARVSTGQQEERGLSIPEQFREIRRFAATRGIEILGEYKEATSAFRHQERRHEFHKMLQRAKTERDVSIVIVHDLSRFCRDSRVAKNLAEELRLAGVQVVSVTDPVMDRETPTGVFMEAIVYAKNEAYSREVAFHTRKGCRANVQTRNPETGWCYKNGGQPLFGYRSERLERGEVKRGRPIVKCIWVPDETVVAGRRAQEWARHCLVELAGRGASLDELRDFCNATGIPARRKKYWGTSTWHALLQPSVILQYCGYGVWNVRDKQGRERPASEWVIVENAHEALIPEEEARRIIAVRKATGEKRFGVGGSRTRKSPYLLSGGIFRCGRCGANMIGFRNETHCYYVCGSQPYRKGMGCGTGVYVPQKQVEAEVLDGLRDVVGLCADAKGFTSKVNRELRQLWEASTGFRADANERIAAIDKKIGNIRQAVENGLNDAKWANMRLQELISERKALTAPGSGAGEPPQLDVQTVNDYRRQTAKLFRQGEVAERKKLLRALVEDIRLLPGEHEVAITYRLPEAIMNGLVAGGGFEPPTFGL